MSEEKLNNEANKTEDEKLEKIHSSIKKIDAKENKILFCLPDIETPSALMYEIFFHATTVKNMGYNVILLTEKEDFEKPTWIESKLTDHEYIAMSNSKLSVGPEDFMIITETHSNVMEQTKELPCKRIALFQSIDYKLNSLIPGVDWTNFGIDKVITTSETLKEYLEVFHGKGRFDIKVYDIGIPEYFKKSDKPQKPVISIIGRNSNEISKIVKMFYSRFPQYTWVTFDPMLTHSKPPKQMRRMDFANRLKENFAAVWVDRISSFGTFPLECMKSGVLPISLKPDIMPDYMIKRTEGDDVEMIENAGEWTNNFYDIPILLGEVLIKFLDDSIDEEMYKNMDEIVSKYNPENSQTQLEKIYNELFSERKEFLTKTKDELTNKKLKT